MQNKTLILTFWHVETAEAFCRGIQNMIPAECINRSEKIVSLGPITAEDVALVRRQWMIDTWKEITKIEVKTF